MRRGRPAWYRSTSDGIVITVRLTPKGGRDDIDGIVTLTDRREAIEGRVRAAPENGAANTALRALLAKVFDRPKTSITIIGGLTGRLKQVEVKGDPAVLAGIAEGLARSEP